MVDSTWTSGNRPTESLHCIGSSLRYLYLTTHYITPSMTKHIYRPPHYHQSSIASSTLVPLLALTVTGGADCSSSSPSSSSFS